MGIINALPIGGGGGTGGTTASEACTNLGAIPSSQKGAANGVATLDGDGVIPSTQIHESLISTWREVPLGVAVADWTLSSGIYTAEFSSEYITSTCKYQVVLDDSWRSYAKADITTELKSGGGAILLHTSVIPTGTIIGTVSVLDADDGKTMTVVQDTVTSVAHGGTGASSVAGAKANLEIPEVVDNLTTDDGTKALSARQGKALNDSVTTLQARTNLKHTTVTVATNEWQNQTLTPFTKYARKSAGTGVHIKNISPRLPSQGWIITCGVDVNNDQYFYTLANGAGAIVFDIIYTT